MNEENYVSFEVAKLLKEKGFKELCLFQYTESGAIWRCDLPVNYNEYENEWSCPSLYEAQKWLREELNIFIVIVPYYSRKYEIVEYEYRIATYFDLLEKQGKRIKSKEYYEKYEECMNAAILEALKLI